MEDWTTEMVGNLPDLQIGSGGEHVKRLQGLLISHGFDLGVNGIFGLTTDAAMKTFQANIGLASDGLVSQKTWRALIGG